MDINFSRSLYTFLSPFLLLYCWTLYCISRYFFYYLWKIIFRESILVISRPNKWYIFWVGSLELSCLGCKQRGTATWMLSRTHFIRIRLCKYEPQLNQLHHPLKLISIPVKPMVSEVFVKVTQFDVITSIFILHRVGNYHWRSFLWFFSERCSS